MLILQRKPGEQIVIGDNIRLTVLAVGGSHVRLGVIAPAEVVILRNELTEGSEQAGTRPKSPKTPTNQQEA